MDMSCTFVVPIKLNINKEYIYLSKKQKKKLYTCINIKNYLYDYSHTVCQHPAKKNLIITRSHTKTYTHSYRNYLIFLRVYSNESFELDIKLHANTHT